MAVVAHQSGHVFSRGEDGIATQSPDVVALMHCYNADSAFAGFLDGDVHGFCCGYMPKAPVPVYDGCCIGFPLDFHGCSELYLTALNAGYVLRNADYAVRVVPREIGRYEQISHGSGFFGRCADAFEDFAANAPQFIGIENWHKKYPQMDADGHR